MSGSGRPRAATLVVADLDGTLTHTGGPPEPEVLEAWEAVTAAPGVRVALATARSPRCVRRWFGQRLDQIDLVCCNGALVIPRSGRVTLRPLPVPSLRRALARLESTSTGYCLEFGDHFVASAPGVLPWMGTAHRRTVDRGTPHVLDRVLKVSVETRAAAREAAAGSPGLRVLAHATGDADIIAMGVGKEVAVADLRGPAEVLVALGNDENDRGLLWAADSGFVVGAGLRDLDAAPHVRRVAATPSAVAAVLRGLASSRGHDLAAAQSHLTSAR